MRRNPQVFAAHVRLFSSTKWSGSRRPYNRIFSKSRRGHLDYDCLNFPTAKALVVFSLSFWFPKHERVGVAHRKTARIGVSKSPIV